MKKLLIIGTGGQGKVALDCALEMNAYSSISFLTNDLKTKEIAGYSIYFEQEVSPHQEIYSSLFWGNYDEVIVAIGNNSIRLEKSKQLLNFGIKLATLVHPSAVISRFSEVQVGTAIFSNAVINPFSKIGLACIINTGAIIEHDCIIGDGVQISPNATLSGTVSVCEKSWICAGSSIANSICIGANSIIGAGAVVLNDVPDNVLVAGVPAKIKKEYI